MKLGGNRQPGDNPLLFSISGTGSFICPVAQTRLDIPRPLITQSRSTGGKAEMFSSTGGTRIDNTSVRSRTRYQLSHPSSPGGSQDRPYPYIHGNGWTCGHVVNRTISLRLRKVVVIGPSGSCVSAILRNMKNDLKSRI